MALSSSEKERYARQLLIKNWDQEKLKKAIILIAGIGGLGAASSFYLAAAGVGTLRLCDPGRVDRPDLNRQILYDNESLDQLKVAAAKSKLLSLNPHIHIETFPEPINCQNIQTLSEDCDLIIDGLDNMEARFILNRQSVQQQIPFLYGAVQNWQGYAAFFHPPHTACLACLMPPHEQASPTTIPVVGTVPGTIALIQATEALKFLMGSHSSLAGQLLIYDAQTLSFTKLETTKKTTCPHCG